MSVMFSPPHYFYIIYNFSDLFLNLTSFREKFNKLLSIHFLYMLHES
jgi:hypothetical protein